MTKKDYIIIAKVMKESKIYADNDIAMSMWHSIVHDIAKECAKDNEKFDHERFIKACN